MCWTLSDVMLYNLYVVCCMLHVVCSMLYLQLVVSWLSANQPISRRTPIKSSRRQKVHLGLFFSFSKTIFLFSFSCEKSTLLRGDTIYLSPPFPPPPCNKKKLFWHFELQEHFWHFFGVQKNTFLALFGVQKKTFLTLFWDPIFFPSWFLWGVWSNWQSNNL